MSLIVTGSIGIDSIEAPTGSAKNVLGGSSIYFGAAASFFNPVRLVGAVGEDFPQEFLQTFRHFDIDLDGLETRQGSKTFRWHGRYHENMNERDTLEVELNVLAEDLPAVPEHYRDSQYVFLANTHPAGQMALLDQFPERKLAVADTMNLWIETERSALLDLMRKIDGLVLNDSEAFLLTEKTNIVRAAEEIIKLGPKFVVIKKGEHGAFLMHDDGLTALPAFAARDVVDPTGAGDTFAGGMMGYLAETDDLSLAGLRKAMAYGTIVASYNIESFSLSRLQQIDRKQINERYKGFCDMLAV
ncbi:MAG: PfkB family carbohydrate kinase [Phycisphaeraceae bacterium]